MKKINRANFFPPLFVMEIMGYINPTKNHIHSKIDGNFFKAPPQYEGQQFKGLPFCIRRPLLTSVCEHLLEGDA